MAIDFDLSRLAVGGAARPDSFSRMNPRFSAALTQMLATAPPEIQSSLRVSSGYRSVERQTELFDAALAKYGSPEAARKWVAPPGHSMHNHGYAADLKYLSPTALEWAHANAARFGLAFPLANENWHIELAGARGGDSGAETAIARGRDTGGATAISAALAAGAAELGRPERPTSSAVALLSPEQGAGAALSAQGGRPTVDRPASDTRAGVFARQGFGATSSFDDPVRLFLLTQHEPPKRAVNAKDAVVARRTDLPLVSLNLV